MINNENLVNYIVRSSTSKLADFPLQQKASFSNYVAVDRKCDKSNISESSALNDFDSFVEFVDNYVDKYIDGGVHSGNTTRGNSGSEYYHRKRGRSPSTRTESKEAENSTADDLINSDFIESKVSVEKALLNIELKDIRMWFPRYSRKV